MHSANARPLCLAFCIFCASLIMGASAQQRTTQLAWSGQVLRAGHFRVHEVAVFAAAESLEVVVSALTPEGLFRGGMTLLRLLRDEDTGAPPLSIAPQVVLDYPDHPIRAKHNPSTNDTLSDLDPSTLTEGGLALLDAIDPLCVL